MVNYRPNTNEYGEISEWLEDYHSTEDKKKRDKLKAKIVTQMVPIVKRIARRIARRSYDPIEDLVQAGFVGLLKAIDHFDKRKNDNFRIYAGYLIIGEMKHYIRDKSSLIRVPRYIHELSIRINKFTDSLTMDELQTLTSSEVATALDIPSRIVDYVMQADRRRSTVSLEDAFYSDSKTLSFDEMYISDTYKDKTVYDDIKIIFNSVIDYLPLEDRILLEMYYKQDMTGKEIAHSLKLSQMAVSRKMKNAFSKICKLIEKKSLETDNFLDKVEDIDELLG